MVTFGAGLDRAGRPDPVTALPPLARHVRQGHLAHEHSVLVLLDVQVLQLLD